MFVLFELHRIMLNKINELVRVIMCSANFDSEHAATEKVGTAFVSFSCALPDIVVSPC